MTISLLILAPVPIIGAICYQFGRMAGRNEGEGGESVFADGEVPPPTITRITTTPKNDVVAP